MKKLRIVQGGIENGDKDFIEYAAANKKNTKSWIAPKDSLPGDDAVIYIGGYGFFATATINSIATPRKDWRNRYGAALKDFKLIEPAISLATIQKYIPELTWANYPRSVTTPNDEIANKIRNLIHKRRKTGLPDYDDESIEELNIDELKKIALMRSSSSLSKQKRTAIYRARSLAIKRYVLCRADGACEFCKQEAPFFKPDGNAYLEPHHTTSVADEGPDHPAHVIGLCPNCHRRAHYSEDAKSFNEKLKKILRKKLEPV